jgi:hypothetical protein
LPVAARAAKWRVKAYEFDSEMSQSVQA